MLARARHIFPLAALLSAALLAGLAGLGFDRTVDTFQPLGFTAVRDGGAWRVLEVDEPATGLRAGDRLVVGAEPLAPRELRSRLVDEPTTRVEVLRGDELVAVDYVRPPVDVDWPWLVLVVVGTGYLLIGLYTGIRDPRSDARLFFVWSWCAAAMFAIRPALAPRDGLDVALFLVDQGARSLLPALTLHLFLVFPKPILSRAVRRLALAALYVPAVASLAFHLDQVFHGGAWSGGPPSAGLLALVDRSEMLALVASSLLGAALLAVRLRGEGSWESRRQTQWIVVGLFGGYVPFLALYAAPWSLGFDVAEWAVVLAVAPLGLVPLAFAWAILKYKLWDLGVLVKNGVSWVLTILLGLLGFSLLDLGLERALEQDLALVRNLVTFAAGIGIAGVLIPTRQAIRAGLERLQYRRRLGSRRTLVDLGRDLLSEHDLDEVCSTVVDGLRDALQVARASLLLADDRGRFEPWADPEAGTLPPALELAELPEDLWGRESAALAPDALPREEPSAGHRLFARGFRYALPLVVHGRPVAVAVLGYRGNVDPLDSDDLDLARGLLDHAALAIENARLLREVRLRLEEVARLQEHNQGILESSPAGIAVLDHQDRVLSANRAFAAIAEVAPKLILGRPLEETLPVSPVPSEDDGLVEVAWCEAAGRERHLQLSVARYPQPGGRSLRVLVCHDTSERVAMEAALQERERLASLGMLAAGVAHEVNTPLTGISSYAQMLLADTDPADPSYPILKKMERQTFRASQIVNNLLDFSRNRRDDLHPVSLGSVVEESVEGLRERAADAGVEIVRRGGTREDRVLGHDGELRQVVTNLVANAIDALRSTPGARIEVELEGDADTVRILVSDNGPGIPAERLETIFQPFFSTKLERGGTGLGLAITTNIVKRHRGAVRARNHVERPGCTFTVELPRHRAVS